MPPVIAAAAAAAASYGVGVAVGTITYSAISLAATVAISSALAGASMLLAPKAPSFSQTASDRTHTIRQPVSPKQIIYGQIRTGGPIIYQNVHGDPNGVNRNKWLNLVIPLAAHEVEEIGDIYFNDEKLPLDANGFVTGGTYYENRTDNWNPAWQRGMAWVRKYKGTPDQGADQWLINETADLTEGKWTVNHVGKNTAYLVVRLEWNSKVYQSGIPNITAVVKGKKVYDPRTGTTAWSDNAALCIRDYLLTPQAKGGVGAAATELLDSNWIAAANLCDEAIPLSAGGTEKRYTLNGNVELSSSNTPQNTLEAMLTACSGNLSYAGGYWRLLPGAYRTPTVTLTDDDFRGPIKIQTRVSRRELFNGVKGTYVSPDNLWQPSDYPPIVSNTAMAEDGGNRVFRELDMPYTVSASAAQRLAKIDLLRGRQPIVLNAPCKLTAFRCQVGDVVYVTRARQGWNAKPFEVAEWSFAVDKDGGLGVDLVLRETAASAYDWATSEEQATDPAPNTNLPDWRLVGEVTNLSVDSSNSQVVQGSDGTLISRAMVTWTAPSNAFVDGYEIQWRLVGTADWSYSAVTTSTAFSIDNLPVGVVIDVRVRARNSLGIYGNFVTILNHQIGGFSARPNPSVTGLKVQGSAAGSPGAFNSRDVTFVWDPSSLGILFDRFVVEIRDATTNALRRQVLVSNPTYTYLFDDNVKDGLNRTFKISVSVRNTLGNVSAATTLTATNPVPALPTAVDIQGGFRTVSMRYTPPGDPDWQGILIWRGTTSGFAMNAASLAYQGPDTFVVLDGVAGQTYYIRYAAYDAFGTSGVLTSAEQVVSTIRISHADLMTEVIDSSNLYPSLNTQIDKIPVLETAITTEQTARQNADDALATQITTLSAGVNAGFNATASWYFDSTVEGWTAVGGTASWQTSGALRIASSSTDPYVQSPTGLSINGAQNRFIRAKVTRVAGSGWDGTAYYTTSGHGMVTGFRKNIPNPNLAIGSSTVLNFDMYSLTAGTTDWQTSTITRIRLDLGATTADQFDLDWIAIGSEAPAASTALVQAESAARATAISAEATARQTLQTTVDGHTTSIQTQSTSINGIEGQIFTKIDNNGYVTGYGISSTLKNGVPTSDFIISADRFSVAKPGSLSSPVIPFIISTKGSTPVLSFAGYASIDRLLSGTIDTETLYVGGTNVVLDGPSRSIRINNGTSDLVRIGRQVDGVTYGITINDASGNLILSSGSGLANGVVKQANLAAGQGVNLLYNSDFQYNTDGWASYDNSTGQPITIGRNINASNTIPGLGLFYASVPNTPTSGTAFTVIANGQTGGRYPCVAGRKYEASAYMGMYRAGYAQVGLRFFDAAGATLGSTFFGNPSTSTTQFVRLNQLTRSAVIATAPANAVTMAFIGWCQMNGGNNPYLMMTQAYLGEAGTNQTEFSPWVPGPSTISASGVSGLGSLATQNNVTTAQVSGLGSLATASTVPVNLVSGLGSFATASQINQANASTYIAAAALGSAHINDLSAAKLTSGVLRSDSFVQAGNNVILDGQNGGRLYITDPRTPNRLRVYAGHMANVDYGFWLWDAAGTEIFGSSGLTGTYIKDATVGTLKIANEAVLIPRSASTAAARTGNGAFQQILNFPIVIDQPARLVAIATLGQNFINSTTWAVRMQIYYPDGNSYFVDRTGGVWNDSISLSGDVQVNPGTYTCVLWWQAPSSVTFKQAHMVVLGAKR